MISLLADSFQRRITYLRVSVTDKCNLRCVYCMQEDMVFRPNADLMQDDELITLVKLFAELGGGFVTGSARHAHHQPIVARDLC